MSSQSIKHGLLRVKDQGAVEPSIYSD